MNEPIAVLDRLTHAERSRTKLKILMNKTTKSNKADRKRWCFSHLMTRETTNGAAAMNDAEPAFADSPL